MTEYGMVFTPEEMKKQLANSNRDYENRLTWQHLFGSVDLAKQRQLSSVTQDYSKAMADAYASSFSSKQDIAASNLGEGYKAALSDETDLALQQAYDAYRQNYLASKSEIETAAAEATSEIDAQLSQQANYMSQFANTPYQYLQWLFDKYADGEDKDNIFLTDDLWKRYTYVNDDGETLLKPWEDIVSYGSFEESTDELGNVQRDWTGLFDSDSNLTVRGADFYDQMMNYFDSTYPEKGLGFGKWLSETNKELYDWSISYNPYNYTDARSNVGSFRTMVGLTSTDQEYSFIERFGGMTKSEVDNMFSKFTNKMTELTDTVNDSSGRNGKKIITEFKDLTAEVKDIATNLGITDDLEKEMGMSFDELGTYLADLVNSSVSKGEIWSSGLSAAFGGAGATAGAAAAGAMAGSALAGGTAAGATTLAGTASAAGALSSIPVAGWIAAAVLAIGAATYSGIKDTNRLTEYNKSLANEAKNAYTSLVTNLVSYSHAKRRQTQSDFYKYN